MLSTSALTWAAAQEGEADWKFLSRLSEEDKQKISLAYAQWRQRVADGEKRPRVDWRSIALSEPVDVPPAKAPAVERPAQAAPAGEDAAPWEDADPDVSQVLNEVTEILSEEPEDDYISLDDFNLEPTEDEMKEMEQMIKEEAVEPEEPALEEPAQAAPETPETDSEEDVRRLLAKLPKDAEVSLYEAILGRLTPARAKALAEELHRDFTRRHRGTAGLRGFLEYLKRNGED